MAGALRWPSPQDRCDRRGPGAAAGVKSGDQILAINGESTANLILPDVREAILREAFGDKLTPVLESGGEQRAVVVILKDLV